MPRFKWHGPPTAQTFTAEGSTIDMMLVPGAEVQLPDCALTSCLIASGQLELVATQPTKSASARKAPQEEPANDQ